MATYTYSVTGTSANTAVLNSTKVRVVSNVACYYAINANASITSNVGPMIAANRPTDINMGGIGKVLGVATVNGSGVVTVTEIGTVYQSAMNQNSTTYKAT